MSNQIPISTAGRIGTTPELSYTRDGTARAHFRLAVDDRRRNEHTGKCETRQTIWHDVIAWGTLAEAAARQLSKGDPVLVTGELVFDEYQARDGHRTVGRSITAAVIGPDIRLVEVSIMRDRPTTTTPSREQPAPESAARTSTAATAPETASASTDAVQAATEPAATPAAQPARRDWDTLTHGPHGHAPQAGTASRAL